MRSPVVELLGAQEPRLHSCPPRHSSAGPEIVDLAASAGLVLDPWQALAVESIFAEDVVGMWAAFESACLVARQNGKGGIIEAIELGGLFLLDEMLLLHSAHEFKTSKEGYLRIKGLIEGAPHLSKRVRQFRQSNEDTSIELISGARLRFMARSRSSGRGFSAQRLIIDEAQILSAAAMGALMPTLAAQTNPQINYFGTVPRPEDDAEHFTALRDRGRAGDDPYLAWLEWNAGESCDDLDDREAWAAANPALGLRIPPEFVAKERASLSDEDFARERLTIWSEEGTSAVIDADDWAALADIEAKRPDPVAFSVVVSPDRKWSSIGLAGRRTDDSLHVQIVQSGRGTTWLPDRLKELVDEWDPVAVALHAGSPAGSLIPAIEALEVDLTKIGVREMGQACGLFVDLVDAGTVHHSGQPLLAISIGAAQKRRTGETWVWQPKGPSTDISPLEAVTIAVQALATAPPKKKSGAVWAF